MAPPQPSRQFKLVPKVINGGIAGIIGVTCVFPIDLVKTRLQNQIIKPDGTRMYTGMIDCFRKSLASNGFRGMYSGSAVNILFITPEKAIKLCVNDVLRYQLSKTNPGQRLPLYKEMMAGGGAGFCQIIITTPMELLKIQLQQAGVTGPDAKKETAKPKPTALAISRQLFAEKGIRGLYRGTAATMARDVTFSVIYFPLFARLDALAPRKGDGSGDAMFVGSLTAGCFAGGFASFLVNPIDVVKTRLQMLNPVGNAKYNGVVDAFTRILREEGVSAFFKGASCRIAVIAPLFGIAQSVYYLGAAEKLLGIDRSTSLKV